MKKSINKMLVAFLCLCFTLAFAQYAFSDTVTVIRTSEVSAVVTQNNDGSYNYNYTVKNTSPAPQWIFGEVEVWPMIVDFEIPLNSPNDVWNVKSPEGWSYEFISFSDYQGRFGEPNPFMSPYVLHWYTGVEVVGPLAFTNEAIPILYKPIVPQGYNERFETNFYEPETDGFMMDSDLSPVSGPYSTSWQDHFRNIGDPPVPGGSVGGGGTPPFNPIPIPPTGILLLTGIGGLAYAKRKIIS
ncbi:MAG: hypothetical protein QXI12_09300 [Candidatus Methanomethyliaceae archaeon]